MLKNIQKVFSMLSCIYLIRLCGVEEDLLYKYGRTQNYNTRKYGHIQEYKSITKHIVLVHLEPIKKSDLKQAENDIRFLLRKYKYPHKRKELLLIPNNCLENVKSVFLNIGKKFRCLEQEVLKKE